MQTYPEHTSSPGTRPFGLYLFLIVVALGALQVSMFLSMADKTVGTYPLLHWSHLSEIAPVRPARVALLRSENSARLSVENPEFFYNLARQWEITLKESGIDYRVISDRELGAGIGNWPTVLVLPTAVCLSDGEREVIRAALNAGTGIVISGAVGARNADCSWRGWSYLQELTGLESPEAIDVTGQSFGAFRGGQFFGEGVPTGYSLDIPRQELVVGRAAAPDVVWTDWRFRPQRGASVADAALAVHGVHNGGRFVWYGFKETLPEGRKLDRGVLDQFMNANVRWSGREPLATIADWPGAKSAAVMIAEDIDSAGPSALPSAALFREAQVPATFFCRSQDAALAPGAMHDFAGAGEMAIAGDAEPMGLNPKTSGENQKPQGERPAGSPPANPRFANARLALEKLAAQPVLGFNPPQALWDAGTVAMLNDSGYSYYLDHYGAGRGVPELIETQHKKWLLPLSVHQIARIRRTAPDDFEVIADYSGPTPYGADLADAFVSDFRRSMYFGMLHTLMVRNDLLAAPENLPVLKSVVEQMKQQPVWIATGTDLTRWWERRARVRVESRTVNMRRIQVSVTNRGPEAIEKVTIFVHLPYRPKQIRVIPSLLGRALPETTLLSQDAVLRLDFQRLGGQSSSALILALDEN